KKEKGAETKKPPDRAGGRAPRTREVRRASARQQPPPGHPGAGKSTGWPGHEASLARPARHPQAVNRLGVSRELPNREAHVRPVTDTVRTPDSTAAPARTASRCSARPTPSTCR